ncbi:hypothetical protein QQS21_006767 [Conoideocrella luteorostrata]|uniref:Uncharacterized protein n=1 Tax=Conoideocrella luteorostrata TaxID=1105319 RepID=A0AAJ0CPW3_9HYPO|nr:hypothetical protein QQS21_006767 [Conoideocrella luteorostrata]
MVGLAGGLHVHFAEKSFVCMQALNTQPLLVVDPPQRFLHIVLPIMGSGSEALEAAIQEGSERLKLWYTHDPSIYWQKNVETDKTVGGASRHIH